jgi:replication factor C small subunit
MLEEFLFVEKYRPKTIEECILPDIMKTRFQGMVEDGDLQNMLFFGHAGAGKTTVARALCDQIGCDTLFINASKENGIDTLRTKITQFVSSVSLLSGKRKMVILDEAGNMSPAMQNALKSFIEEYSDNAGFILTSNHRNKIIDPILSRTLNIEFNLKLGGAEMMAKYMTRVLEILDKEKIKYDPAVVAKLIAHFFPDFRRVLNEIQGYSASGEINSGIFAHINEADADKIMGYLAKKDWANMRKYFEEHAESINIENFVSDMYELLDKYIKNISLPEAVMIIAEFDRDSYFATNKMISNISMCTKLMTECEFK